MSGPTAELAETHISWVSLMPERVLKIIKPIEMPFVDFSDSPLASSARRERSN